jgi:curli production assembly/transport component CsgF
MKTMAMMCLLTALAYAPAHASELVYVPTNPAFGGSPLNANGLLSAAQLTNKHKDPELVDSKKTGLQQFADLLERSILGQLAAAATSGVMGAGGKLQPGIVETGNFRIEIVDAGGGLLIVTTIDKLTGASSSFQVGGQ